MGLLRDLPTPVFNRPLECLSGQAAPGPLSPPDGPLPKQNVAGSNPVSRSTPHLADEPVIWPRLRRRRAPDAD